MEGKLFNAAESLKDWDPSISKKYCGPGKQYIIGNELKKITLDLKNIFEKNSLLESVILSQQKYPLVRLILKRKVQRLE